MNKLLPVLIITYFLSYNLFGQSEVDSLRTALTTQAEDTNKVKTYLYFFYTDLYYNNPDEVIQFTKQAAELSKTIDFPKGESDAYNTLGYMHRIRSQNDSALYYFQKGADIGEEINYTTGIADGHTGLGNTYNQMGEWQKAIPHFQQVIATAEAAHNEVLIASANNNIGNIYLSKGAYTKALEHYQKSVDLGNPDIKQTALINIGLVHNQLEDFTKARQYLEQSIPFCEKTGNKYALAFVYQHLGSIEQQSGHYPLAIEYFGKATETFEAINERYNVSDIQTNTGDVYFDMGAYDKAMAQYQKSMILQKEIGHYVGFCNNLLGIGKVLLARKQYQAAEDTLLHANLMADTLELLPAKDNLALTLSKLYKETGDYAKALEYHEAYKKWSDSLTNLEKSELIAEMEAKYEISQKEQEIELLSAENQVANLQLQKQQNLRNYLMIIAIALILLVAVGFSRYQIKVKANQKLRELDHIKTNFFTNISHEFRTPLTLILNPVRKLRKSQESTAITHDLQLIQRNAERLLDLTNQLLDLSKLEAGKLQLSVSQHNLHDFLHTCLASFESLAKSKKITFMIDIKEEVSSGWFDQDNVQKILNNLLSNAFKFTPEKGLIAFIAYYENDFVVMQVKDTGPGISSEQQEQIFERFHQNRDTEQNGGSGIGLTLTKELVLLHRGIIAVESTPGMGSTFTVKLPVKASAYKENELVTSSSHIMPSTTFSSLDTPAKIAEKTDAPIALVVEDNPDLQQHISSLLSEKYTVVEAFNGKEGLEKAIKLIPDIVISDWMMPEMNGLAFCEELKKDERSSHIPIIMLTAKADKISKLDGLKTGADDYLTKPFDTEELLIRMDNLIEQRANLRSKYGHTISIAPSKVDISDPDEAFITKALTIVDQHISDSDFTVEQLQKEIGMSRMQLHRKLKALTNLSASEFIRNLRLQRAADLLAANGTQVSDIAYQCGFNSLSYFTQCFKEKYGVTPSKYEVEV
jgi:signal transduction histidine kinase/DNA-binding response OmpR family regulator